MKRNEYTATAVSYTLWFLEFRKVVSLLSEGKSFSEINDLNKSENIFGAPTSSRANMIFRAVKARIESLDSSFIPIFMESDVSTQKLISLAASMSYDTLFFDFVYEVVREKLIIGNNELTRADANIFFKRKQEQEDTVAKWTDETIERLARSYRTQLFEAGMLDENTKSETRYIYKPILDPVLKHWLEDYGYESIVKAMEGTR